MGQFGRVWLAECGKEGGSCKQVTGAGASRRDALSIRRDSGGPGLILAGYATIPRAAGLRNYSTAMTTSCICFDEVWHMYAV